MRGVLRAISGNVHGLECPGRTATYLPSLDDAEPGHAQRRHDTHINALRHRDLIAYAEILGREGGQPIRDPIKLIAPMLRRFMAADGVFTKAGRALNRLKKVEG